MKAHFETVQTKGNIFWKWKRVLKLYQVKETYFENESAIWNSPNYPSLLARCFILVVSLQNYFQKYHTCGDPSKLFSKTVTCGDLSKYFSFSFQFLSPMVTFAILLGQKILRWWPSINQIKCIPMQYWLALMTCQCRNFPRTCHTLAFSLHLYKLQTCGDL